MKILFIQIIVLITFLGCGTEPKDKEPINYLLTDNLLSGQIDSIYNQVKYFPNNIQLAIAFIQNGKISYYGIERKNDTLVTIENERKVFEIGSISKVLTTTLLADFVVKNELHLDSSINTYFDYTFNNNEVFTFKELANHTSGLPRLPSNIRFAVIFNSKNPYKKYDERKLDKYLKDDLTLDYKKGSKSEYSNLGMGLLSYTLRKYSGKSYETLINEKIFDKYKMMSSTTEKSKIANKLVGGLDDEGRLTPNWDPGALIGAGGVYSSVEDLTKFALGQFDSTNVELTLTRNKTFKENDFRDVGLGWFIINRKNGDTWHWHNGGTGGYTSSMALDVDHKNGVIILSNISAYHKSSGNIDNLCFSLLKSLI